MSRAAAQAGWGPGEPLRDGWRVPLASVRWFSPEASTKAAEHAWP